MTAATPCATNGACSYRLSGKAEVEELRERARPGRLARRSARRASPPRCATRAADGEFRACRRRTRCAAGRRRAIASRLTTATTRSRYAVVRDEVLDAEAPERAAVGREEEDRVIRLRRLRRSLRRRVRARQLEQAAVPDALSFAPGLAPVLSRCATTTITSGSSGPGAPRAGSRAGRLPRPGIFA